jgi:hypothetical protein
MPRRIERPARDGRVGTYVHGEIQNLEQLLAQNAGDALRIVGSQATHLIMQPDKPAQQGRHRLGEFTSA